MPFAVTRTTGSTRGTPAYIRTTLPALRAMSKLYFRAEVRGLSNIPAVFRIPGARASLSRYGTVPASPENMKRALERDAVLLVYPGGDHETYRPSWESGKIDFAGRRGFAKLAIEHGLLRLKVFPAQVAPPFGLTILDLAGTAPAAVEDRRTVLPKIDLQERLGGTPDPGDAHELVTGTMQEALSGLADERRVPVLG